MGEGVLYNFVFIELSFKMVSGDVTAFYRIVIQAILCIFLSWLYWNSCWFVMYLLLLISGYSRYSAVVAVVCHTDMDWRRDWRRRRVGLRGACGYIFRSDGRGEMGALSLSLWVGVRWFRTSTISDWWFRTSIGVSNGDFESCAVKSVGDFGRCAVNSDA